MSERTDPSAGTTTQGAIEESRFNATERTAGSGITSGAAGAIPAGMAAPATARGYSTTGSGDAPSGNSGGEQTDTVLGQVTHKTSQLTDQAGEKLDAGKEKAAGGLESLAGMVREKSESMSGGQVQSVATKAADTIEAGASMLRGEGASGGEMVTQLETMIRNKPAESLAIAAGLGFLLAKALK